MERNRDLRRANISAVNGFPARRQRITTLRDSTDQDRQMDLQETVRLGDREQVHKDRERDFSKRRRVDRSSAQQRSDGVESYRENESTDSSDEEYYEVETRIHQQNRTNQLSPTTSSPSNNRRGLRTLRSSPVLRAAADEMFGVPIPRRARSSSAKRLHEYCNSGSGGFGEDFSHRRFSPSTGTVSLIGSAGASPSSSGASMKKKLKSVERRPRVWCGESNTKPSTIQDDIEIEVAEALFDLMKQSQSQSQPSQRQEKVERDSINTDELKMLKADGGKDGNSAFSIQHEPSVKVIAETILGDSVKDKRERRIERKKSPDDQAQELVNVDGDGFVNKVKVGSPKESESLSCVKVNARDIQDPTVTKAHYEAIIAEANKKEAKVDIDLMALPPLPPSPGRDALVDIGTDPEDVAQVVQKKREIISKDGPLAAAVGMQVEKIGAVNSSQIVEKRRHDDIVSVSNNTTQQQQGRKEQKNQSPNSLLPFHMGMNSWSGVLPHLGYMAPLQAVLPINGSAKASMIVQPPQFKFSQSRARRCATHQFLAHNIHSHQELTKKSLSSVSTGPAALYGNKSSNSKYMFPPTQNFIPGNQLLGDFQGGQNSTTVSGDSVKDKSSDAAVAFDGNATTNGKSLLQQASHLASASNFLHPPGFIFPLGHHQTSMMSPANSSGSSQSAASVGNASLPSNSAGRLSVNLPLSTASAALSLNHQYFPSNEAYMAILQNNGCPIPMSASIAMPPFKGGPPSMPYFNPSLYSSSVFNVAQNQQQLTIPHTPHQSSSQTTNSSSHKQPQSQQLTSGKTGDHKFPTSAAMNSQQSEKSGASVAHGLVSHSVKPSNSQMCSLSAQPMNFAMLPPVSVGGGAVGNKNIDPPQQGQQGSKGRVELIPQAFAFSFGSSASTSPALNFSSMVQNSGMFHMLPEMSWNSNQMVHPKNFQASEGKSLTGQSFTLSKSDCKEMSALATMGPPKFDALSRTMNFHPGNQPFQTSSAPLSSGVSVTIPILQQQQMIQVQNSQMHQLLNGTAQVKSSASNSIPGSYIASIFSSTSPVFTQVSVPSDNSSIPQLNNSQGQTQLTFGSSPTSAAPLQGHKIVMKSDPASSSSLMVGLSSNSSISRNTGVLGQRNGGTAASTLSPQEVEASPGGTSQKSSPACRRNVPSILSACPSQLPELKY